MVGILWVDVGWEMAVTTYQLVIGQQYFLDNDVVNIAELIAWPQSHTAISRY